MENDEGAKNEDSQPHGEGEEIATRESEESQEIASEEPEESPQQATRWTKRKKLVAVSLCVVVFTAFTSLSIISPFFPNEALKKGASHAVIGLIFSVYPLVGIVMSPVYGKMMPKFGAKNILLIGLLIEGITTILFGFVTLLPDGTVFIVCCFLLRIIDALGSAGCETAAFVIIAQEFPDNVASVMGVLDTFTGVGLMAGPPLGGLLFTAGGFKLPFIVMGVLELLTVLALVFSLPSVDPEQGEAQEQSFLKTLKIPAVVIMGISAIIGGMNLTYLDPILSPYLSHFGSHGLSIRTIGFIFLIPSALYASLSPATGRIGDKTKKYYLMIMLGFLLSGVCFMLVGPMPFFDYVLPQRTVWLACVALVLLGISFALLLVPIMPEMLQIAKRNGMPEDIATTGIMSGIYGSAMNCGAFIGPMMAGAVTGHLGFKWATGILAFILFFQTIVLVIFYIYNKAKTRLAPEAYGPYAFSLLESADDDDQEPLIP